jgi:hypothetical protein
MADASRLVSVTSSGNLQHVRQYPSRRAVVRAPLAGLGVAALQVHILRGARLGAHEASSVYFVPQNRIPVSLCIPSSNLLILIMQAHQRVHRATVLPLRIVLRCGGSTCGHNLVTLVCVPTRVLEDA